MTSQHPTDDLLDHLWVAVIVTDAAGVITTWSRHAEDLYGYTAEEAIGQPLLDLVIVDRDEASAEMARLSAGDRFDGMFRMRNRSGRVFEARCRTVAVPDGRGGTAAYVGASFEPRHRPLTYEEQERLAAAERTADRLVRLQSVSVALLGATEREEVAEVVVTQGVAALGADAGSVSVVRGGDLEILGAVGYDLALLDRFRHFRLDDELPMSYAVRTGESVWLDRSSAGDRFPTLLDTNAGHQSLAAIPLRTEGGVIGCIGLSFEEARAFPEDERLFVETLASQCAQAMERARLYAEARESQEQLTFLAKASSLLASSLDYVAPLRRVAALAVPVVADLCVVHIVDEAGTPRPLVAAHDKGTKADAVLELFARYPLDHDAAAGAVAVARTGRSVFYANITDEILASVARDERHLAMLRDLGLSSGMTVPLVARGRPVGVLSLVNVEGRNCDAQDLALAEELATRAAQAIDNALLYRERSEVARTLQASLLPPRLPDIEGVELGARYLAAGGGSEVGGDFYDAFLTGPGRWVLVIGDVQGKGVHAAAITGLARHTIRSFALVNDDPCDVLSHLNDVLLRADDGSDPRFCTVCIVRVEPHSGGAHLTICSGGHPLPVLLRADGSTTRFGCHGSLLGVLADPELSAVTEELGPGDALVCLTDGITERHEDQRFLEDDLPGLLAPHAGETAAALAERIERLARDFVAGEPRDDMAVLVVRVPA